MKILLKLFLIFLYILLAFVKPDEAFASFNFYISNVDLHSNISVNKTKITIFKGYENYYAIVQNNNSQFINNNSKNNNSNIAFGGGSVFVNNNFTYLLTNKNFFCNSNRNYVLSKNLKNNIYTRAP